MKQVHDVIYIPGLGDHKLYGQNFAVKLWRIYGIRGECSPVIWNDREQYRNKQDRLNRLVAKLASQGHIVSIIGSSAGASAAINTYAENKDSINAVVAICGKILHPETVEQYRFDENPAFEESLQLLQQNLATFTQSDLDRMLSVRPLYDDVIDVKDMIIPGAHERTIQSRGHARSIAAALTVYSNVGMNFIKSCV